MNPPYGREISTWVKKAYQSAKENGATVVCLVPARVDTRWWHDYCAKGEVHFLKGRLRFSGCEHDGWLFPVFEPHFDETEYFNAAAEKIEKLAGPGGRVKIYDNIFEVK